MKLPALAVAAIAALTISSESRCTPSAVLQPVSVDDLVRFATIGDPRTLDDTTAKLTEAAAFSPDGKYAAVVVSQGNPERGTNDAVLLVYETAELLRNPTPVKVAEFASATNSRPMAFVRWLRDSETLYFAGTQGNQPTQVYRVGMRDRKVEQLTSLTTQLTEFDVDAAGERMIVSAERPRHPPSEDPRCSKEACRVTGNHMFDWAYGMPAGSNLLSIVDLKSGERRQLLNPEESNTAIDMCFDPQVASQGISPDGRFVLRLCEWAQEYPPWWRDYTATPGLATCGKQWLRGCGRQYAIIDLASGKTSFFSDAPAMYRQADPLWIDDGRYLVLPGAVESLANVNGAERAARAATLRVLLVDSRTLKTERIATLDSRTARIARSKWDPRTQTLRIEGSDASGAKLPVASFERRGKRWLRVESSPANEAAHARTRLTVEQGLNSPPLLVATGADPGSRSIVLDPNPWLAQRALGRVEGVTWKSRDGSLWTGGLYYPPDYVAGNRYPLMVQTHGFSPAEFSMHGLSRNYAGRALAAHGIMVLQVEESYRAAVNTPAEYTTVQAGYEGAIDHLHGAGLIDRSKVGIQGWSRTGPQMGYTLVHSDYKFAAGAFTDTADFGWQWYLYAGASRSQDALYGAAPFGEGLKNWMKVAATFNLERVDTPMLMWGDSKVNMFVLWDWYAGLIRLGKPVEYWTTYDAAHDVFKVGTRRHVNNLLVDWFRFWLKGEEDPDPAKAEQYVRWRKLELQQRVSRAGGGG